MVRAKNAVAADYSDIDIQLKRRSSLIGNLVDTVKSYAKHEEHTFENIAKARSAIDTSQTVRDAAQADNMLTRSLRSLFAVVENYPTLQASQNYKQLQDDIRNTEDFIAMYREEYNKTVLRYNNKILTFPTLYLAHLFGFEKGEYFQST
jgi:LemA protein